MSEEIQKTEESFFYILNSTGFIRNENSFTKTVQGPSQTIIVNGQQMVQPGKQINIEIKYIGEGFIEDTPVYGFEVIQDGQSISMEYFYNSEEFHSRFYSLLM